MSEPKVFKSFNVHKAYEKLLCEKRDLMVESKAIKESRDDLLDFIEFVRERWKEAKLGGLERFDTVIKRAKAAALKEKGE